MGYMTIYQDAADFELSVHFRVDNLRELLTTSEEGEDVEPRTSTAFWPGFKLKVSPSTEGKQRKCRLSLYLFPCDAPAPAALHAAVSVQSFSGYIYSTKPLKRLPSFEHGRAPLGTLLAQRTFETSERMQREDAVIVRVVLRSMGSMLVPSPTPRAPPTLNLVHRVLTARPVSETRFVVFRRRDSAGHLSCPRAFFANMRDLAAHYAGLEGLLDVGGNLEGFELPRGARLDGYNLVYEQGEYDSDFEPDEEEDEEDGDMVVVRRGKPQREARAGRKRRDDFGSPDDSLVMQEDIPVENCHLEIDASMHSSTSSFHMVEDKGEESDLYSESTFDGTTIVLLDTASRTWEALLYYLYTGNINENNRPAPASCRSIYRLAHKLELEGLRRLALQFLASQLSPETVLTEVFSEFTARYEEVKEMELGLVVRYWDVLKASAAFKEKMVEVTSGSVPHAADVISEIMLRVSDGRLQA